MTRMLFSTQIRSSTLAAVLAASVLASHAAPQVSPGGDRGVCTPVTIAPGGQPPSRVVCPGGIASLSVGVNGSAPFTYRWEIESSPGTWTALAAAPTPLPCSAGSSGGSSFATTPAAMSTLVSIHACSPNPVLVGGATRYNIRCVVTNACGTATSSTSVYTYCPVDINCASGATVQDVFDFLAAWFGGSNIGNFNGVGGTTVQDIFDFLAAWFAGC